MNPGTQSQWVAGDQIQGGRDYQEDNFAIRFFPAGEAPPGDGCLLLLLADGMGGYAGGAVASETIVRTFQQTFQQTFQAGFQQPAYDLAGRFNAGVDAANQAVRKKQLAAPALAEMGATLVAAAVIGSALYWVSVGDSPLWLFRAGQLRRLNADHSMRPLLLDLVELGRMIEEEALSDPRRNQLRSSIYGEPVALVDMNADGYALEKGDLVLLASDGLETLSAAAMVEAIRAGGDDAQAIAGALLDGVSAAGKPGQDNATVLVYRVGRGDDALPGTMPGSDAPGKIIETASQGPGHDQKAEIFLSLVRE